MQNLFLPLIVGVMLGCVTGLFPGLHINIVAAFLLASLSFGFLDRIVLVVFIVAMAITHTFIDFIPSVFLGAPEEDSFLSVLPGHQLLMDGKGFEAVVLALYGSLIALPIILVFSFVFVYFLDDFYEIVRTIIPFVLIFISLYVVFSERDFILAGIVFLMAGFLGLIVFELPVKEPLLPLLSGLFGIPSLVVSLKKKTRIPKQEIISLRNIRLKISELLKGVFGGCISAPLCSFLPGIGSGHAAVIGSEILGIGENKRVFLFLVGMINTIVMALSFVTIYAIGRTRSGAAVAVFKVLGKISVEDLVLIIFVVFLSGMIAFVIGIFLARFFARAIEKFNYGKVSIVVIVVLFFVNLVLSNWLGVLVLTISSALGVFAVLSGVRRIQLMGVLLIPVIVFYLV